MLIWVVPVRTKLEQSLLINTVEHFSLEKARNYGAFWCISKHKNDCTLLQNAFFKFVKFNSCLFSTLNNYFTNKLWCKQIVMLAAYIVDRTSTMVFQNEIGNLKFISVGT